MYINAKELTDWMVDKYGTSTGDVAKTVFEVFEHLQKMEKVAISGE